MTCNYADCKHTRVIFTRRSDWKSVTHFCSLNAYIFCLPISETPANLITIQEAQGQTRASLSLWCRWLHTCRRFRHQNDLKQHQHIAHPTNSNKASVLFCDQPGCSRGPGPGNSSFKRKDNLRDHMRRKHGKSKRIFQSVSVGYHNLLMMQFCLTWDWNHC
jgi:hypothetical protein